jgi:four helix bundle protein
MKPTASAMKKAHAFEDLKTWQMARELVREVYALTNTPAFGRDTSLRDQPRRAAVSSMSKYRRRIRARLKT